MNQEKAVVCNAFGDAGVMTFEIANLPEPEQGFVRMRNKFVGVNFIDIAQRRGAAGPLSLPSGLGFEAVGVIEKLGSDVVDFTVGDRVVCMNAGVGAYCEARNVLSSKIVRVPENITDEQAASIFFKGLTAQYLVKRTYRVKAGDLVLVHAAAGGVGQILVRWAKALGAEVVGVVGREDKFGTAREAGCDFVVASADTLWPQKFLDHTNGRKAAVAYDSVGKDVFLQTLDCVATFGTVVHFGAASGPAPDIAPEILNGKGCLYLTRPSVFPHNATRELLQANADELFSAMVDIGISIKVAGRFALSDVQEAHRAVESRKLTGAVILEP